MSKLETTDKLTPITPENAVQLLNDIIGILYSDEEGEDPNVLDADKEWDEDTIERVAQQFECYCEFDRENPTWLLKPSSIEKCCTISGLPEDCYDGGIRRGTYPNLPDAQVELLVAQEMELFNLNASTRWNPGHEDLERYLRSQHGRQVEVNIYEMATNQFDEQYSDAREKLLHICDLMDDVEKSMVRLNEGKIILDGEPLLTLQDFIVNQCGEDEA